MEAFSDTESLRGRVLRARYSIPENFGSTDLGGKCPVGGRTLLVCVLKMEEVGGSI